MLGAGDVPCLRLLLRSDTILRQLPFRQNARTLDLFSRRDFRGFGRLTLRNLLSPDEAIPLDPRLFNLTVPSDLPILGFLFRRNACFGKLAFRDDPRTFYVFMGGDFVGFDVMSLLDLL